MDRGGDAKFAARRVPDFAKLHALEEQRVARWKRQHRKELTVPQAFGSVGRSAGDGPIPPVPPRTAISGAHRGEGGMAASRPASARPVSASQRPRTSAVMGGTAREGLAGIVGNPVPALLSPTAGGSRFVSKVRGAQEAGASFTGMHAAREVAGGLAEFQRVGAPTAAVLYPAGFKGRPHAGDESHGRLPGGHAGAADGYPPPGRRGSDGAAGALAGRPSAGSPLGRGAAADGARLPPRGDKANGSNGGDELGSAGGARAWTAGAPPGGADGAPTGGVGEHSLRVHNGSTSSAASRATTAAADRPSSATARPPGVGARSAALPAARRRRRAAPLVGCQAPSRAPHHGGRPRAALPRA